MLDAPLASALEVMVYAGAIMVLFVFVVMLLNIKFHERAGPLKKYIGLFICCNFNSGTHVDNFSKRYRNAEC